MSNRDEGVHMDTTGQPCRLFYIGARGNRQLSALAVGASAALIAIEIDDATDVVPAPGDAVHLLIDGRMLHTSVHRVDEGLVTVLRPEGVELSDLPEVLPARAGFGTSVRGAGTADALSVWVLDMSVRGARVLGVIDPRMSLGDRMTIDLDGRRFACRVSAVHAHRHPEHAIFHLDFDFVDGGEQIAIVRLLGALRSSVTMPASWLLAAA